MLIYYYAVILVFLPAWASLQKNGGNILRDGSIRFNWWVKSPAESTLKIYIYNVTNAEEFLKNGSRLTVNEVGPYVYREKVQKRNFQFNKDGTILTYDQEKTYFFDQNLSVGSEDDYLVVPNIPLLTMTSKVKSSSYILKLSLSQIIRILDVKPFVNVTVNQLLWGYDDPLLKISDAVDSSTTKPSPLNKFGLFHKKNSSIERVSISTGSTNITQLGLIQNFDGKSYLEHFKTEKCNNLKAVDGTIFPPDVTKSSNLYIYDNFICKPIPVVYLKDVVSSDKKTGYRFSPLGNVFSNLENNCFCPEAPCSTPGFLNVSSCQYDTPVLLSFPHFYLAEDKYRTAVEGISAPDPEKHILYLDVDPVIGAPSHVVKRIQYNFAASHVTNIPEVEAVPDIILPVMWYEEIQYYQRQTSANLGNASVSLQKNEVSGYKRHKVDDYTVLHKEKVLSDESSTFNQWAKSAVESTLKIYIYNVTNAEKFKNGSKLIVKEVGPYVYREKVQKKNFHFNEEGTILTYDQEKTYFFDQNLSNVLENDLVVVPNIPLLTITSKLKNHSHFVKLGLSYLIRSFSVEPFVKVTVKQLLWGYGDPLLRAMKSHLQLSTFDEFGLFYKGFNTVKRGYFDPGYVILSEVKKTLKTTSAAVSLSGLICFLSKNTNSCVGKHPPKYSTYSGSFKANKNSSIERVSIFTGSTNITKLGLIYKFDGKSYMELYKTEKCNNLKAVDGKIFPPDITKNTRLYIYNNFTCKPIPLVYLKDLDSKNVTYSFASDKNDTNKIREYRFSPPENVFANVDKNPENDCYCPDEPCSIPGFLNISACQYGTPVLLSFPHFYLADDKYRTAVEGISPPDPDKQIFYIDVNPQTGAPIHSVKRMQYNFAASHVTDISKVEVIPDIILPVMWYEEILSYKPTHQVTLQSGNL